MGEKLTVMVTGIGGGGHGEQILKALRFSDLEYEIVGGDMSLVSTGFAEVDHPYLLPPAGDERYVEALLAVCRRHGVRALFHGSEPELKAMSRNRAVFEDAGIFLPINTAAVIDICMDKVKTMRFLESRGFAVPATRPVERVEDLEGVDFLPAVLKPSIGGGASANVMLAQTAEEVRIFGAYLLRILPHILVQEYVGTPDQEYTVGVLNSMDGTFINSIVLKRALSSSLSVRLQLPNRTGRSSLGDRLVISSGLSQGEIGVFPEVAEICEQVASALGARASINIQCRRAKGKVWVFEINPRFSGTTSLRAMVGFNEPDILIRKHLLREPIVRRFDYRSGIIMRGLRESLLQVGTVAKAAELL